MTDHKSRVQLALELADALPVIPGEPTTRNWGGTDSDQVAEVLMQSGGVPSIVIALANALLAIVDERETQLHPIARAHPAPTSSPGEDKQQPDEPFSIAELRGHIGRRRGDKRYTLTLDGKQIAELLLEYDTVRLTLQEALAADTHEGATAAEWASRYASLAEAAYPALAWLPRNEPGARMVAERLEGVLAGQGDNKAELEAFRAESFRILQDQRDEAQAELTRLKEENARLSGELENLSEREEERRDELRRQDAVVEAARALMNEPDGEAPSKKVLVALNATLSALDRPEGEQAEDASVGTVMERATYLPAPHIFNLSHACAVLDKAFDHGVYLVGSALERRYYRDVDVRAILDDAEFDRLFPRLSIDAHNPLWSLMCASISLYLQQHTGLPVDFQIQRMSDANKKYPGRRHALGMFTEGAEQAEAPKVCGTVSRSGRMSCTEPPLHDGPCADKGDAFAVATPPEPPAPAEAPRELYGEDRDLAGLQAASEAQQEKDEQREVCERLLRMHWLYPNYRVDSRGPMGLLREAIRILWPQLDEYIEEHDFDAARDKFFPGESDPEPPAERPVVGEEKL